MTARGRNAPGRPFYNRYGRAKHASAVADQSAAGSRRFPTNCSACSSERTPISNAADSACALTSLFRLLTDVGYPAMMTIPGEETARIPSLRSLRRGRFPRDLPPASQPFFVERDAGRSSPRHSDALKPTSRAVRFGHLPPLAFPLTVTSWGRTKSWKRSGCITSSARSAAATRARGRSAGRVILRPRTTAPRVWPVLLPGMCRRAVSGTVVR
jgi:hypothetical protein